MAILLVAWRRSASASSSAGMPLAVVFDDDGAHAAASEAHGDLGGTGVERVVDQLAHHRGRALDDLAGGDLAHQFVRQFADRAAPGAHGVGIHPAIVGTLPLPGARRRG